MADAQTAIQTTQPTAIQKRNAAIKTLGELIQSKRDAFALVAGKHYDADRLVKLAQAALSRNPGLAECTPGSVLVSLMKCSELGVEPDSALPQRRMWLVPRKNKRAGTVECIPQLDYRAQLQLARDTGIVSGIVASAVHEKDGWTYEIDPLGDSMVKFAFKPIVFGDRGPLIGYFAAARLKGGEVQIAAMSKADAERFRARFASSGGGPWSTDFDAMALKTCLRRLWNLLPAGSSPEALRVQEAAATQAPMLDLGSLGLEAPSIEEEPEIEEQKPTGVEGLKATIAKAEGVAAVMAKPAAKPPPAREPGSDDDDDAVRAEIANLAARQGVKP